MTRTLTDGLERKLIPSAGVDQHLELMQRSAHLDDVVNCNGHRVVSIATQRDSVEHAIDTRQRGWVVWLLGQV